MTRFILVIWKKMWRYAAGVAPPATAAAWETKCDKSLRGAVGNDNSNIEGLGTKLARRFARRGLDFDIPEISCEPRYPVYFEE
jgi:hypothetical protein